MQSSSPRCSCGVRTLPHMQRPRPMGDPLAPLLTSPFEILTHSRPGCHFFCVPLPSRFVDPDKPPLAEAPTEESKNLLASSYYANGEVHRACECLKNAKSSQNRWVEQTLILVFLPTVRPLHLPLPRKPARETPSSPLFIAPSSHTPPCLLGRPRDLISAAGTSLRCAT